MKRAIPFLILFYIMVNMHNVEGAVKKINYRGWNDCYLITNDSTRVVINASAGGRIMVYERNGINVIYENNRQDGKLLADYLSQGFDPDGGRFDYGQELITRDKHALTYMGPWKADINDDFSVQLTSQPDHDLGILSTRTFSLDPKNSQLTILHKMENISPAETEYFVWGRTLVRLGGKLFIPLNPKSKMSGQWGRYIWGDPVTFNNDPDDKGVKLENGFFTLIPSEAENQKYGTDSQAGWMAYGYSGLLFIKSYGYQPEKEYAEHYGQTAIFYTNKKIFAEMEPIFPIAKLKKGESASFMEKWYLEPYSEADSMDFDVPKASKFVEKTIERQ